MLAMQYGFDLPDSFDLNAVRHRIAEIGPRFDQLPGLYLKAFLVADRDGTHPNRYAPFYLWNHARGMMDFLLSDSFKAVVAKYGRPVVHVWSPVAFVQGAAIDATPKFAMQETVALPADADLAEASRAEQARLDAEARTPALHTAFVGLDPNAWQLTRTSLWQTRPQATADARVFELRHLSAPGLR